jgi:hypothetical protein
MNLPPDNCVDFLKGIINGEKLIGPRLFDHTVFSEVQPVKELTGWNGSSINWDLLGGNALNQLLDQKNKVGEVKFKFGVIRIPRKALIDLIIRYGSENLGYELREENGNIYHGHVLFISTMESRDKTTICAILANEFTQMYKQGHQNA